MAARVVFLDTSFIISLDNRDDPHHERAKQLDRELTAAGSTCLLHWGILLEIADGFAKLGRRTRGMQMVEQLVTEHGYALVAITAELLRDGLALYCSRPDKEWGLTDWISFVLMQQKKVQEALTADHHFQQAGFKALLLEP